MLGPMNLSRGDSEVALPASRKVRALLAYLAVAPAAAPRRKLCELLWDSPGDPRGELRWSLSKLRGMVGAARVITRDDTVRLDLADCSVDALAVERAARSGIRNLAPERAKRLLAAFGGDFLEGLEIERCPVFASWLLARRRCYRELNVALLARLIESLPDAESLGYVERWLELAPLDVRAHERALDAFARSARLRDGNEHVVATARVFCAQGLAHSPLRRAWRAAKARAADAACGTPKSVRSEQAYEHYLRGCQHLARMMRTGLEAARQLFVSAVELDPGFAPAWAGLATVHACLNEWFGTGASGLAKAEQTSRMAVRLAPQLAESRVARGLAQSLAQRYDEAAHEFEAAIRINPYLFDAWYYFARTTFARGDLRRSARLFGAASELREEDFQSPILLGTALRALGRESEAFDADLTGVRRAEQVLAADPLDGRVLSLAAGSLFDTGQVDRALEWSRRSLELYPDDASALVNGACLQARAGEKEAALELLERVFAQGCGKRGWVENDPDYASLRSDSRFQRLVARLR
jgi:DNA-binding SARP family transcriptional activator